MKKKGVFFQCAVLLPLLAAVIAPNISSGAPMEILEYSFDISATPRQEWYPSISYNPTDNEFMFLWHASGKLRNDCDPGDDYDCTTDFHTIHGQRVSTDGELLGDPFRLSPPELGWKTLPKSVYNPVKNEYALIFSAGPEFLGQKVYIMRIDPDGSIKYGPELLPTPQYAVSHPVIRFNSTDEEYLVGYNDTHPGPDATIDNFCLIFDPSANLLSGPNLFGTAPGTQFNPQMIYNSVDNTYLGVWEDFRHAPDPDLWFVASTDLYGALVDADGKMIGDEFPVIDDTGMEDEGSQQNQFIAYNPDDNEFLVSWGADEQPSLDAWGGIVGTILNGDGTPKGEPFVICDEPKPQHSSQAIYIKEKKQYFIVWADSRNDEEMQPGEPFYMSQHIDIYGKWLKPSGEAAGPDIPLCTEEGVQAWPTLSYSPSSDRLLVAWHDLHAPDDWDIIPGGGGGMVFTMPSNIRATLLGASNPCAVEEMYGKDSKEVALLRNFRDTILDKTAEGKALISLYYQLSPAIVTAMEHGEGIKKEIKTVIDGILPLMGMQPQ